MANKVWMVTGASRGFGAEISKAVLNAGDKLVATARNPKGLELLGKHGNLLPRRFGRNRRIPGDADFWVQGAATSYMPVSTSR